MARMPDANWLGEHAGPEDGFITSHDIVCIHTIVGHDPAHAAHFSTDWSSGKISQSRDTARQSDANAFGNDRVIAIENEDFPDAGEDGVSGGPLSDAQVESCARILAWAHKTHGVPLQYCPDSKPGSRGLAVHRQGIDGNFVMPANDLGLPRSMWLGRVDGGELWTESFGKECPRNNKIAQVPAILRRAKEIVNGDWFDMATRKDLREVVDNALAAERSKVAAEVRKQIFFKDVGGGENREPWLRKFLHIWANRK